MITLENIGLVGFFSPCEEDALKFINRNFTILDGMVQFRALDFIEELPDSPSLGDIYILDEPGYAAGGLIAIYDGRTWQFVVSKEGFFGYVISEGRYYYYSGTEWLPASLNESDVNGPNSALPNSIARFDGATGKWITDSGVILDDDDVMSEVTSIYAGSGVFQGKVIANEILGQKHTAVEGPAGSVTLGGLFNTILVPIDEISALVRPDPLEMSSVFSIENKSGETILIKNNSLIVTGTGGDLKVKEGMTILVVYSDETETFNIIAGGGSNSGGGGGSSVWREGAIPPIRRMVNGFEIRDFNNVDAQEMHLTYIVPENYEPGTPLKLVGKISGVGAADDILLQATAALFKDGVNTPTVPAGTHTSINTALTIANDDEFIAVEMDLTDTDGEIGGDQLAPGNTLNIKISRGTDTSTNDLSVFMDTLGVRNA